MWLKYSSHMSTEPAKADRKAPIEIQSMPRALNVDPDTMIDSPSAMMMKRLTRSAMCSPVTSQVPSGERPMPGSQNLARGPV